MFDTVFCVAKGVVELEVRGVYGVEMINKQRYFPNNVPSDDIDNHFEGNYVVAVDCLEIKTYEGKIFKIHFMKESDYVMKLMASWMTLNGLDGANTKREWK